MPQGPAPMIATRRVMFVPRVLGLSEMGDELLKPWLINEKLPSCPG
jgi:hypothetical protein